MSRDESPIVRPVSEDEGYNWTHRAFLQAFQTHSVMTVDVMKAVLASILTAHSMFIYFNLFLTSLSLSLSN